MWNPKSYDRFNAERQQPSIDLARRLEDRKFQRILDVGCGSGLSTEPLCRLWPDAEVIGLDNNPAMLAEARKRLPTVTFIERDCSKPLNDLGTFDLVFSNAFIQWIPNAEDFITDAMSMLADNGVFALQVPLF